MVLRYCGGWKSTPHFRILAERQRTACKILPMPKKPHPGRKGEPVSLHPLTPEQAISGMFKISKADVKRIVASKPGKKGRKK